MSASLPRLDCMCATLRRAARALTQHYDDALRPLGLTPTQFTILQTLSRTGELLQGTLGEFLSMDSTTLTRTLAIMTQHGWIAKRSGKDRRERWLRLSKTGEVELARALPLWNDVQQRLRTDLGNKRWDKLLKLAIQVTSAVTE